MTEVPSRELRARTRALLDRVEAGESITITVDGNAVAILEPVRRRAQWMRRDDFVSRVLGHQADPGLRDDLAALGAETTDDVPDS